MNLEIRKIAVIGAGTMGRGIAHVACLGGFDTFLQDISGEMLKQATTTIHRNFDKSVERGLLTQKKAESALSLSKCSISLLSIGF